MNLPSKKFWQPLIIVIALLFIYVNVLKKLIYDWWNDENYSHGLLIPFVIAYIIWMKRHQLRKVIIQPAFVSGIAITLFAFLFLWAGTAGAELFTQRMSLVLLLAGISIYFWGWRIFGELLFPLTLLALAIPIPTLILNKVAFPLQLLASNFAVWAMQIFDIPVLRQGNVIEMMPYGALRPVRLEVVVACSGIRSLMTLVSLAALYAYFTFPTSSNGNNDGNGNTKPKKSLSDKVFSTLKTFGFWRSVIVVVAAVPIAILTNTLRVTMTGFLATKFGMQVAEGFLHNFSGWVVYMLAFGMTLLFGFTVDRLFGVIKKRKENQSVTIQDREQLQA